MQRKLLFFEFQHICPLITYFFLISITGSNLFFLIIKIQMKETTPVQIQWGVSTSNYCIWCRKKSHSGSIKVLSPVLDRHKLLMPIKLRLLLQIYSRFPVPLIKQKIVIDCLQFNACNVISFGTTEHQQQ